MEDFALHLPDNLIPSKRVLLLRYKNRFEALAQSLAMRGISVTSAYPLTWMKKKWTADEERRAKDVDGTWVLCTAVSVSVYMISSISISISLHHLPTYLFQLSLLILIILISTILILIILILLILILIILVLSSHCFLISIICCLYVSIHIQHICCLYVSIHVQLMYIHRLLFSFSWQFWFLFLAIEINSLLL